MLSLFKLSRCVSINISAIRLLQYRTIRLFASKLSCDDQHRSNTKSSLVQSVLSSRVLVQVSGDHAQDFLQGLLTNDVRLLETLPITTDHSELDGLNILNTGRCLYSFLLSSNGRVLTDLFVYRQKENEILLELDRGVYELVIQLLQRYRIRRKVEISLPDKQYRVVVVFSNDQNLVQDEQNVYNGEHVYYDPRDHRFGLRILQSETTSSLELFPQVDEAYYRLHRYRQGLPEGCLDLPADGHSLMPFEANGDWLRALSFNKGCYIGQELTARTRHLGVVRKRIMPVVLQDIGREHILYSLQNVVDHNNKTIGRFRINFGLHGLAVLKFADIDQTTKLRLQKNNVNIIVHRPSWWPNTVSNEVE